MTTQHTKGPWGFNVGKNGKVNGLPAIRIYSDAVEDMVLDFAHANGGEDIANARLIAAAPELLEALEKMRRAANTIINAGPSPHDANYPTELTALFDAWSIADKAIAKAKAKGEV